MTLKRVLIIVHLCLVFTCLSYVVGGPFVASSIDRKLASSLEERVVSSPHFEGALPPPKAPTPWRPSPFTLAWMFFSIATSIFLLLDIRGARQAVWILPLIVAIYGVDLYLKPPIQQPTLFPEEAYVVENYGDGPLPRSTTAQRDALLTAWNRYLATEWGEGDLELGSFRFDLARLSSREGWSLGRVPLWLLLLYLAWNLFFAVSQTRAIRWE